MSGRILNSLRKRKLQLISLEASAKYRNEGLKAAREYVEVYMKILARTSNPFEKAENIQSKSFVVDETVIVKAYNINTGYAYISAQIDLTEELEMDSEPSCTTNKTTN